MSRPIGVNTWVWTAPTDTEAFAELAPKVRSLGFDLIEVAIEDVTVLDYRRAAAILTEHDLQIAVTAAMGPGRDLTTDDERERAETLAYLEHCIDACEQLGATRLVGPIYATVGRVWRTTPDEREAILDRLSTDLRKLSEGAASRGVTLAVEPLNRFETSLFNTAEQTMELVEHVDHPGCGVLLDTFHMNIEEKSLGEAIRRCGDKLVHVHACGNDRGAPGNDHIPWDEVARALDDVGYQGPVVIESFTSDVVSIARAAAVWRSFEPSQNALAEDGLRFLRGLFA